MSIETKIEKKDFEYAYKIGKGQVVVECDISTDGRGGLSRILTVTGDVQSVKIDCFQGEAKVYGKVCYKVLYLNDDNNLTSVEYCSDFVESIGSSDITPTSELTAGLHIVDIDSLAKGDSIRLQAVVDIVLEGIAHNSSNVVVDVSGALAKNKDIETSIHIAHIDDEFNVVEEYFAGCNIDKILLFDSSVYLSNMRCNKDSITVMGEAKANILYLSDSKLVSKNITIPYSQELKCLGIDKISTPCMDISIKDSKIVLGGVEDNNSMRVELTLRAIGDAFDYARTEVVEDVYSPCMVLDIKREDVNYTSLIEYKAVSERVDGEASLDEELDGIKKIITAVPISNVLTNTKVSDGLVVVDMLIDVKVVYLSLDDKYSVLDVELPSSISVPSEMARDGDIASARVVIGDVSARVKRERDIDIVADIEVEMNIIRDNTIPLITEVVANGDKTDTHKTISIYFARKSDTMWDIMKNLGASEEIIRKCNDGIDFENLQGGEKILVFRGLGS